VLTLWPERVKFSADFLLLLARGLLGAEIRYAPERISRPCRRIVLTLRQLRLDPRFRPAAISHTDPGALLPHEARDRLDRLIQPVLRHFEGEPQRLQYALRSYMTNALLDKFCYATLIDARVGRRALAPADQEFVLERHPANGALVSWLRDRGYRVRETLWSDESLRLALGLLGRALAALPLQAGAGSRGNAVPGRPAIWIEWEPRLLSRQWSLLFWKEHVAPRGFDIVCYLDRNDSETTPEVVDAIQGRGIRWLDCRAPHRLVRLPCADLVALARAAITRDPGKPWWLRFFRLRYQASRSIYRALYSRYAVKALIEHQEASWQPNAQAEAVEEAGGIMVGTHWSSYPGVTLNTHTHPQQVYFVWGRSMRETLDKKGHTLRHVLPSGLSILPDKGIPPPARRLLKGLGFVMAIFDSSIVFHAFHSARHLSAFYDSVLGLLEEHKTWGAAAKRKGSGLDDLASLPRGRELVRRARSLVEEGRLVFAEHTVSPATVSQETDLAVCYSVNTPGIVAGILGGKAVHWDCAGHVRHAIYSDPGQKILYRDLGELRRAVAAAAAGDTAVGDFSKWRRLFDEFGDDKGPARVGAFLQSYMDDVVRTGDSKGALERAVDSYVKANRVERDFLTSSDASVAARPV
jgi:hypothetical protein